MGEMMLIAAKWYIIVDIAFLVTALFTLVLPSWRMAIAWAKENLEEHEIPTKKDVIQHIIAYFFVGAAVFPALAYAVIMDNKSAVQGYTRSLIEALHEKYL